MEQKLIKLGSNEQDKQSITLCKLTIKEGQQNQKKRGKKTKVQAEIMQKRKNEEIPRFLQPIVYFLLPQGRIITDKLRLNANHFHMLQQEIINWDKSSNLISVQFQTIKNPQMSLEFLIDRLKSLNNRHSFDFAQEVKIVKQLFQSFIMNDKLQFSYSINIDEIEIVPIPDNISFSDSYIQFKMARNKICQQFRNLPIIAEISSFELEELIYNEAYALFLNNTVFEFIQDFRKNGIRDIFILEDDYHYTLKQYLNYGYTSYCRFNLENEKDCSIRAKIFYYKQNKLIDIKVQFKSIFFRFDNFIEYNLFILINLDRTQLPKIETSEADIKNQLLQQIQAKIQKYLIQIKQQEFDQI